MFYEVLDLIMPELPYDDIIKTFVLPITRGGKFDPLLDGRLRATGEHHVPTYARDCFFA